MATTTTTSTLTQGVNTYYDKLLLDIFAKEVVFAQFAQKRPIPPGNGKTISFYRWLELAGIPTTASGLNLTEGSNPSATTVSGMTVSAILREYGAYTDYSSMIDQAHIDVGLKGLTEVFGNQAATVVDNVCQRILTNGAYALVSKEGEWDNTGGATATTACWYEGTINGTPSTTEFTCTSLIAGYGSTTGDWNASVVTFTGGKNKGISRYVMAQTSDGTTATVTVDALPNTPASGDTFAITSPHVIASTDKMGSSLSAKARSVLRFYGAQAFDGYYIGLIGPDEARSLQTDTNWVNAQLYQGKGLFTGEIGRLYGIRWIEHTNPYYAPYYAGTCNGQAANTYGVGSAVLSTETKQQTAPASGNITCTFVLGKNAFGVSTFSKDTAQVQRPRIIRKNPGPGDTSNPLNRFSTVGWVLPFVAEGLNSLAACQLWTHSQA